MPGGVLPQVQGLLTGHANLDFNFTCEVETAKKRAVIRGEITYHDDPQQIVPEGTPR